MMARQKCRWYSVYLKTCILEGEMNHVKGQLAKEIAELIEV
jgi:hypothetical protein